MTSIPRSARRILVVCEANRARSPVTARFLQREVERRGLSGSVQIDDAGLRVIPGEPLLPSVQSAIARLNLGLEDHLSTPVSISAEQCPDLVLTMTQAQRHAIVRDHPELFQRTFTIAEAVRLVSSSQWPTEWDGTPDVVARMHRMRPVVPPARQPEDVPDPATGGRRLASSVVERLRSHTSRLARALWGAAGPPHAQAPG